MLVIQHKMFWIYIINQSNRCLVGGKIMGKEAHSSNLKNKNKPYASCIWIAGSWPLNSCGEITSGFQVRKSWRTVLQFIRLVVLHECMWVCMWVCVHKQSYDKLPPYFWNTKFSADTQVPNLRTQLSPSLLCGADILLYGPNILIQSTCHVPKQTQTITFWIWFAQNTE